MCDSTRALDLQWTLTLLLWKLDLPLHDGLQGPRPWGLCSLWQGMCCIHSCGVGACADMGNYKGHLWRLLPGATYCTAKCRAWEQSSVVESGQANCIRVWDVFCWAHEGRGQ